MMRNEQHGAGASRAHGADAARPAEGRWPRICEERSASGATKAGWLR
jgi:hypothetical protein